MIPLATVPMMPSFIAGFVDWGDGSSVLPVLRLEQVLRLPLPARVPGLHTPIIVVRKAQDATPLFGLLVETVTGFASGTPDKGGVQDQAFNGCVVSILNVPDRSEPVSVLSVERLLLAEEKERLIAFQQILREKQSELVVREGELPAFGMP